jgi:RNA-directed DNA polymerase
MNWEEYSQTFIASARLREFDDKYIERCLRYGRQLAERNLPIIYSLEHFSLLVGIDERYLSAVGYSQERYYRDFAILKKSGGVRQIYEPLPNLKTVQRWILDNILYRLTPSPYAKGFVPRKSIKDNARFHKKQEMLLCLDVKDFFPSISTSKVRRFFLNCGYSKALSYFLTRICTLHGGLPQGAPTSPTLSNLIFTPVDDQIAAYCRERRIRYTRYADDLTFSGSFAVGCLISHVRSALSELNLTLNESKTRLMRRHERQEVTGVVVNEKMQATRDLRRSLRQAIYFIRKFGLDAHLGTLKERRANYTSHLLGQAIFVLFLNPSDRDALAAIELLRTSGNWQSKASHTSRHVGGA